MDQIREKGLEVPIQEQEHLICQLSAGLGERRPHHLVARLEPMVPEDDPDRGRVLNLTGGGTRLDCFLALGGVGGNGGVGSDDSVGPLKILSSPCRTRHWRQDEGAAIGEGLHSEWILIMFWHRLPQRISGERPGSVAVLQPATCEAGQPGRLG